MKITNGLIAAIAGFEPDEALAHAQLGNLPVCLACGFEIPPPNITPLCNPCAHTFVRVISQQLLNEEP